MRKAQAEAEVQPAGILKYVEELTWGPNAEMGPKNFFEIASGLIHEKWMPFVQQMNYCLHLQLISGKALGSGP